MGVLSGARIVTTSGTREQLSTVSQRVDLLEIFPFVTNGTAVVYIGGTNVSAAQKIGVPLMVTATDSIPAQYTVTNADPSDYWIDATASGVGVSWIGHVLPQTQGAIGARDISGQFPS